MTDVPEALPPEVNSALVHGGAGPMSLETAALAFAQAAATDAANAQTLRGIIESVRATWEGDTAERYAGALQPLVEWFDALALNGTATAQQVQAAAAAITAAIAGCPHPVEVTTNRTTYAGLAATNFFGVNLPPMGVLDGQYLEMYFQAAFARGTSDIETEVATTTLVPFDPPPIPVNLPGMGTAMTQAMTAAAMVAPLGAAQAADLAAAQTGWATSLAAGAAGDGVGLAGNRPNSSWAARANETAHQGDAVRDLAEQPPTDSMTQLASQAGGMIGQVGSMPAQAGQALTAPLQQVASAPQQFSSLLQPLMSAVNSAGPGGLGALGGTGGGVEGALAAPAVPAPMGGLAGGSGALSAALTRPASLGAGLGRAGGLRLPGAGAAVLAAEAPGVTGPAGARLAAAGGAAAAGPGGTGFLPTPRNSAAAQRNSANRYESHSVGIDAEQAS